MVQVMFLIYSCSNGHCLASAGCFVIGIGDTLIIGQICCQKYSYLNIRWLKGCTPVCFRHQDYQCFTVRNVPGASADARIHEDRHLDESLLRSYNEWAHSPYFPSWLHVMGFSLHSKPVQSWSEGLKIPYRLWDKTCYFLLIVHCFNAVHHMLEERNVNNCVLERNATKGGQYELSSIGCPCRTRIIWQCVGRLKRK